jgi:hypothetical protein
VRHGVEVGNGQDVGSVVLVEEEVVWRALVDVDDLHPVRVGERQFIGLAYASQRFARECPLDIGHTGEVTHGVLLRTKDRRADHSAAR